MSYNTIQQALDRVIAEKPKYEANLVGKKFIYVYIDKSNNLLSFKEVEFKAENYLHLTGLDYKNVQYRKRVLGIDGSTYADEFYRRLGTDKSLIAEVSFITEATLRETQLTYRHTQDKLENLSQIVNIAKKASYIGTYKLKGNYDLIINRNNESLALVKDNNVYVPISSRYGNVNTSIDVKDINDVLAIFSKENGVSKYILEYLNPKAQADKIYFHRTLTDKLSLSSFENPKVKFNAGKLEEIKRTFLLSEARYVSEDLSELAKFRQAAYTNYTAMNTYMGKCKVFRNTLDTEHKMNTALDILQKLYESETDIYIKELIEDEIKDLNERHSSLTAPLNIMNIEFKPLPENTAQGGAAAVDYSSAKGIFGKAKDTIKSLFTPKSKKRDKSNAAEPKPEENAVHEPPKTKSELNILEKLTALAEARRALASNTISFKEYNRVANDCTTVLHDKEEWLKAVENLRKQLDGAPDNIKVYIRFEVKVFRDVIERKFAPKPQQTLAEIQRRAHEEYIRVQNEKKAAEKEKDTVTTHDRYER